MGKKDRDKELVASFSSSTVADVEYDIIKELHATVDNMQKSLDESDTDGVRDKLPYLKHLINDLEETLSGDFENLRYKRFITKKTL
jgi:hypothetical protein